MKDYWNKLNLNEAWSQKARFNKILNYIDEVSTNDVEIEDVDKCNISFKISDDEENVVGATVTLYNTDYEHTCSSDENGECVINDVIYGDYSVNVSADGYLTNTSDISVDANTSLVEIVLTKEDDGIEVQTPSLEEEDGEI